MRVANWIAGALVTVGMLYISAAHGLFLPALVSLFGLFLLCWTAMPLSEFLFSDKVAAHVFVFPLGYVLHAFLLSLCGRFLGVNPWTLAAYLSAIALLFLYYQRKKRGKLVENANDQSRWKETDTFLLFPWLLLALVVVSLSFLHVGAVTPKGTAYRAYFNTDLFRNMAVTGGLVQSGIPPDNPYFSGYFLYYYWFFHVIPAFWLTLYPADRADLVMVRFSLAVVLMFVSGIFVVLRQLLKSRKAIVWTFPLFVFGGSYEGLFALQELYVRQAPLWNFRSYNIDGILRWFWKTPQMDTLYRALLFAPQHLIALSFFLMFLYLQISGTDKRRRILFFTFLCCTLGFSAFIGAFLLLSTGLLLLRRTVRQPRENWGELVTCGFIGFFFLTLYFWSFHMFAPGPQHFHFGLNLQIWHHLPAFFILNCGVLLFLGIAGLLKASPKIPRGLLSYFLFFCLFFILFIAVDVNRNADVTLKTGYIFNVVLLLLTGAFLDYAFENPSRMRRMIAVGVFILMLPALLTWVMDAYNCQDIRNRRFTTFLQPDDAEILRWVRNNLPAGAKLQSSLAKRDGMNVSLVPPHAQRSLYIGDPILSKLFLVPASEILQRKTLVSSLFSRKPTQEIYALAQSAGIDYIFLGTGDFPQMSEYYSRLVPPYFSLVAQSGKASLYRVNPVKNDLRSDR